MQILLFLLLLQPNLPDRGLFRRSTGIKTPQEIVYDTICLYDVLHYNISIELDIPGIEFLDAFTEITAVSKVDSLNWVDLNFCGMQTDSVFADGLPPIYIISGIGPNQLISIDLPEFVGVDDTFKIKIFYHGTPENGVYYSPFNYGLTYVMSIPWDWTDFPIGARYWFPCQDVLWDKATSELSLTVPEGYDVVANGLLVRKDIVGDKLCHHFFESYPIPTWYIVFAVSDYAIIADSFVYGDSSMPIYYWPALWDSSNAHIAFSNVPDMLTFFSDIFGDRYPFFREKYGYVKLPPAGWAMENQTNVFWALNIPGNHFYEIIVAHEASHQWWGCSVTPYSIKDIWLNEGFATYCEALYSDHWHDGISYHEYMSSYIMNYYLTLENYPLGHPYPMYDPPDGAVWTATTYEKGASVLHMLRHILGDSLFFDALRTYYAQYKYSITTTPQFQAVLEVVARQSLDWFFDEWVYMAGHPEYNCHWNWVEIGADSFIVNLTVEQTQSNEWDVPIFKMPIDIGIVTTAEDTVSFILWDSLQTQSFDFLISNEPTDLLFDPENWVLKRTTVIEQVEEYTTHSNLPTVSIYPNPFSTETVITLECINRVDAVTWSQHSINIYDLSGRLVRSFPLNLCNPNFTSRQGEKSVQSVSWDGRDDYGKKLHAGIYFCIMLVDRVNFKYQKIEKIIYIP
ncbi:hypothetical protein KAX02_11390 [candidate division WOR-3 bacterium]|nr:hypothetical protein [candidate division WOR-3 bacterium]